MQPCRTASVDRLSALTMCIYGVKCLAKSDANLSQIYFFVLRSVQLIIITSDCIRPTLKLNPRCLIFLTCVLVFTSVKIFYAIIILLQKFANKWLLCNNNNNNNNNNLTCKAPVCAKKDFSGAGGQN